MRNGLYIYIIHYLLIENLIVFRRTMKLYTKLTDNTPVVVSYIRY